MLRYVAFAGLFLSVAVAAADRPAGPPVLLKAEDLPAVVEPEALQRQYDALLAMPSIVVDYSIRGPVTSISGDTGLMLPGSVRQLKEGANAGILLDAFRSVLLATGSETLTVTQNRLKDPKTRRIRAEQSIRGMPVVNGRVTLETD